MQRHFRILIGFGRYLLWVLGCNAKEEDTQTNRLVEPLLGKVHYRNWFGFNANFTIIIHHCNTTVGVRKVSGEASAAWQLSYLYFGEFPWDQLLHTAIDLVCNGRFP